MPVTMTRPLAFWMVATAVSKASPSGPAMAAARLARPAASAPKVARAETTGAEWVWVGSFGADPADWRFMTS